MVTVEQAKKFYEPAECPSDVELERILASMYRFANREWEQLLSDESYGQE